MLSRNDLIDHLKNAAASGSLLTPKHDPNSGITWASFRTVLTIPASASLQNLIESEKYDLRGYFSHMHGKHSYVLTPHDSASYTPVGLGIPSGSNATTGSYDTFLIVSGSADGWHLYSEDSDRMNTQVMSGSLRDDGIL